MLYILIFVILYGLVPFLLLLFIGGLRKNKSIFPFILLAFLASFYEFVGTIIFKINVEHWFLIYGVLAFFCIHYFLYKSGRGDFMYFFIALAVLFVLFVVVLLYNRATFSFIEISAFFNVYQTSIVLLFSIVWFRRIFKEFGNENLLDSATFYFISGLLIYYCGSVVLFLLANDLYATDKNSFQYYWLVNIILTFVLRTLLIVGIWKARLE